MVVRVGVRRICMHMEMARGTDMGRVMVQVDMEILVAWAWTGRYRRGRQDIGRRVLILSRRSLRGIELRRNCNDQMRESGDRANGDI